MTWSNANEQGVGANTVWVGRDIGVFIVKRATSSEIGLEAVASRDVIVCSVVLDPHEVQTEFAIHETHVGADGADLTMVFVPRHERFKFAARAPNGLQAVTLVIDITALIENRGLSYGNLPVSLRRVIGARELMVEKLIPGRFGTVACEIAAHRPGLAELPELFYEAKSLDLTSALFSEIARRDALDAGGGRVGSQALERLRKVRESIDRAPHRSLDIDALARAAGMNRTKLRLVFRQVYGTTLSGYRNALLLRRADLALKEAGASVTQAAREAGYATPSGFIAAYRRQYGFSPGKVRAIDAAIVSNSCAGRD
ncbi:hypothetical protein A5906_39790 [Bradyrhizobium sacchari]|nr:hypothetical protein A5906_39790 [Bradyrhizobium sacchari]